MSSPAAASSCSANVAGRSRRSSTTCIFEDLEQRKILAGETINDESPYKAGGGSFNDNDATLADSSAVSTVSIGEMCKICHCGGEANVSLIAPCYCSGSLKYVHQECLQRWIKSSDIKRCELCKYPFTMQAKVTNFKNRKSFSNPVVDSSTLSE